MSSVAYSIGTKGNIDAAVPLFSLAFKARSHWLQPTKVQSHPRPVIDNRSWGVADAFKMAGFVRDRRLQALTMLAMGKAMLKSMTSRMWNP